MSVSILLLQSADFTQIIVGNVKLLVLAYKMCLISGKLQEALVLLLTLLIICKSAILYILKEKCWSALPVMTLQLKGAISKSSFSSAS